MKETKCYKCKKLFVNKDSIWEGLHPECFSNWFNINSLEPFQDVVARHSETLENEWSRITSSFFHGKFRKYSAKIGTTSYLLKVQQSELPELPTMEYLCNQLAQSLGLLVPNHFLIRFQNELDAFVCKNFMQDYPSSNLVHIYRFLDSPEQYSCEGLLQILEREVKRYDDIVRFVRICLFDALIGNHDRHGRNLGIIQSSDGSRLAPCYDNPSYLALEIPQLLGAYHEPRGAIATKHTREPTMIDYVNEWLRLGFDESIKEFKNKVNLSEIHHLIKNSFVSPKRQDAFIRLTERRYKELCDAANGLK